MNKLAVYLFVTVLTTSHSLQNLSLGRRNFIAASSASSVQAWFGAPSQSNAAGNTNPSLSFSTSQSGIQWADAKVGSGKSLTQGSTASIDYALSTTGARYGTKIYSNSNSGAPYRWTIGDGTTILGLEEAIVGSNDIPPMQPGGIRRVIIPPSLAYQSLAKVSEGCGANGLGPVPPSTEAFEEFQRFKNIYCNPSRMYQPDVVMDIKLYGKRVVD